MQIMAKGVLNNLDLEQGNPNLSYEGIQRFNPNQRQAPKMGTLKRILSASKESEKISPFKKAAPKPVQIKTAKPAPVPVTQASPITTNVLQPVVDINETAAPAIRTSTPAPIAPVATPKPIVSEDVLSPIEGISIQDNTKVRTAIKNLADRAYSGDRQPLYARDVYENDIKKGILEGDLSTYEDEQGNLSVKRNAPGLMTGIWEGQKMVAENIRKASKYYISSPEEKVKLLEEDRMVESMQPMQESSTGTQIGQTAGNIVGQIVLGQAPRLIPGVGLLLGSAISSTYMGAMQAYDSEKEAYNMARENGLNETDAYDVAEKGRGTYYTTGVAENFVSALVGGRVGSTFKSTASGASKGFAEAVKKYAAATGNKSLEVGLDASVAAISSSIRDLKTEQTTGLDLNVIDRALENAKMEAYAGGAMAVLGSAYGQASKTIPKWLKSQALNMASTMEEPSFITLVDNLKQEGVIDEEGGKKLIQDVQNWNATSESNIDVPAEKAGVINGLTTKKQGLLDKLKTADESSKQAIQSEIDAVDTQISEARNNPDLMAGEVDDLTGLPLMPKEATTQVELPIVEVDKIIKQKAKESTDDVAAAASMVFKDAGYHVGSLPGKSDYLRPGYLGEQPFTGYYFVSNPKDVVKGGSRFGDPSEFRIVDFSKYNLYKPSTDEYWRTKSNLKKFVNNSDNFDKAYDDFINKVKYTPIISSRINDYNSPKQLEAELNKIEQALDNTRSNREFTDLSKRWEEVNALILSQKGKDNFKEDLKKELDAYNEKGYDVNEQGDDVKERFETIMLKMLGFEGVDVRGLKSENGLGSPDKFAEGSVIFDLKPESVQTLSGAYENAKAKGNNPELVNNIDNIIKPKTDATQTTQEQQQEGVPEGDVGQRQRTEGEQDQAPNEADNRNRPISEQEEVVPKTFDTEEGRRVISEAQGIISKTNFRQGNKDIATENAKKNVVEYIKGTKFYENANDVDREQMLRDAQKYFFDTRFKSSPAVTKLFSELEPKKITLNEQSALRRLMRFGEKSAKTAFDFAKDTRIAITDGLRQLEASGKIANKQFVSIMSRYDRINLKNPESIDRFVTYVSKVISDATFNDKIAKAQKLRSLIKRGASLKTGQVNISAAAKAFARINPLNVRDINEYMKIAEAVLDGVKTSKSTKDLVVKFNQAFSTADTQKYIDTQNVFIENETKKKRLADYEYLVDAGVLTGEMSLDEMDGLISDIESGEQTEPIKDKNRYIMAYVQERFDALAPFAQELLEKGEDTFGGTIDKPISASDKKSMSEILRIGITNLPVQDAYRIIESMDNFVANGETYGLDDIIARYRANQKSKDLGDYFKFKKKGKDGKYLKDKKGNFIYEVRKGRKISLFGSGKIGQFMAKQVESLPIFAYKMFRSAEDAAKFFRETGLQDLFNHKNDAKVESKVILADFVGKFEGKMANGTAYNDAKNTIEQGMFAFLRRNKGGSPEDIKSLFDTNKRLITEGIDNLRKGNSEDIELADMYQDVYDKIAAESNTISDVESNVDRTNIEVVNYWTNVWGEKYDALRGVSKAIYRQELDKDNFFNPIAYRKIKKESKESDVEEYNSWNNSGFSYNYEGNITKKMSGTLMKQRGVEAMPDNKYLNFNFIKNSYGSLESALTDIYTAKDVRYVKAMLDSDGLKKIVHEEDIPVLKEKVALYIKRSRNMDTIDYDELSELSKKLSSINRFSTSIALASVRQVAAQTAPLAVKTLITSGRFDLGDALSITMSMYMGKPSAVNDFLDKSGYGVSIRGLESAANLQELNRLVTESNGDISKIAEYINNTNDKALKLFLSNPDSIIARASWISYYKAALKAKGQDINNINWETHKIDQEAADTAEENVNIQQNASDPDMQGAFIGSKKSTTALMRNWVMPFSGFIMNTKAKIQADTNTLISKVTTKEEKIKAARNLAGQLAETHIYTKIGSIVTQGLTLAIGELFGEEESERRYEKLDINEQRGLRTNFIGDTFNPLPASFNTPLAMAINGIADLIYPDTPQELKIRLYDGEGKDNVDKLIESAGLIGIGVKQAAGLTKSIKAAATGEMEIEFAGQKSTKYLSEEEREMLVMGSVLQMLYMTRLVPVAEFGTISNKILTLAEKRGLTERKDVTKDVIEEVGATIDTKTVDGKSISQAAARAIVYTDPEERARYIIGLQDKYGIESVENMLGLLEEAKVLDNGTVANILAIQGDDPNLMKVSRLFSYKKQDARVQKLIAIRDSFEDKADFYSMLKWGMQFKVLNEDGILLLADRIEESGDFSEDEVDMLISAIED